MVIGNILVEGRRTCVQRKSTINLKSTEFGLFKLKLLKTGDKDLKFWICLAVCRIFKRFLA
jgi:hypothetical protein